MPPMPPQEMGLSGQYECAGIPIWRREGGKEARGRRRRSPRRTRHSTSSPAEPSPSCSPGLCESNWARRFCHCGICPSTFGVRPWFSESTGGWKKCLLIPTRVKCAKSQTPLFFSWVWPARDSSLGLWGLN